MAIINLIMKIFSILNFFALTRLLCASSTNAFPPTSNMNVRNTSKSMGGYDATIGVDPTTPIQFFTLPENTCPYAQRTAITFNELQIPVQVFTVTGRPKPDWFLKINPSGKVPTIRVPTINQEVITESSICNEFLCDYATNIMDKKQSLMPVNPVVRAQIRLLNYHCDNVFTKTQFTFLMNKDPDKDKELAHEMENALMMYEESIRKFGGVYLFGDDFTLADIQIYPFIFRLIVTLRHWKNYELPSDKFPKLLNWFNNCSERESVIEAGISEEKILEVYQIFFEMDYKFGGLNQNK